MLQTAIYLSCLASAIIWCYRQDVSWPRVCASLACIAVTWCYIVRFMLQHEGSNPFDAAYADVIWPVDGGSNWGWTQQLLCWAIVAMVWSHEAPIAYQVFGVFGAMSASFFVYRPPKSPAPSVPLTYVLAALVGFICTWMLRGTTTLSALSWWLWALHAALLVPKVLPGGRRVDLCVVYPLLAGLSLVTHLAAPSSPWPRSDCCISITVDLAACSAITLLLVQAECGQVSLTVLAGLLAPVVSPGCILAITAASRVGLQRYLNTQLQQAVARRLHARGAVSTNGNCNRVPSSAAWTNLGYWKDAQPPHFAQACEALAQLVGKAVLRSGDRALCVGCGGGEELRLFHEAHSLASTTGLDADAAAARRFARAPDAPREVRLVHGLAEDMASLPGFRRGDFDVILAVDSIYHCDKARFFADCAKLLPCGGRVAVTDVVLAEGAPFWVPLVLQAMNIPAANHWSKEKYQGELLRAGLEIHSWLSLEPHVLSHWFPKALCKYLDYVLVTAEVGTSAARPTAAVVGSGMSGCVTAWLLAETHDVTVFEAGQAVNLSGRALNIDGIEVDVPLRMIAPHYYSEMVRLIAKVGVPTKPARFDVCMYDAVRTLFITHADCWRTCIERARHLGTLLRLTLAILLAPPGAAITFGAYMKYHGLADSEVYRIFILPQLSWMLSCDLAMVEGYPATAVVAFIRSINPLLAFAKGIVRVYPCCKVLEEALLAGAKVKVNQCIGPIGEDCSICGEVFDAVVIATEAAAVPEILGKRPWAAVFADVRYHPSSVVLHTDRSLMPPRREDWRVLNVRVAEGEPAAELSVWMNAYFGDLQAAEGGNELGPFKSDVFQTWGPHRRPQEGTLIRESQFQRVTHGVESVRLQRVVAELQGTEGFYFAGSYAVHGLGLLEEATRSAQAAVAAVRRDRARRRLHGGADAKC